MRRFVIAATVLLTTFGVAFAGTIEGIITDVKGKTIHFQMRGMEKESKKLSGVDPAKVKILIHQDGKAYVVRSLAQLKMFLEQVKDKKQSLNARIKTADGVITDLDLCPAPVGQEPKAWPKEPGN